MKKSAPERLAIELSALCDRIHGHCQALANPKIRHGLCVVHPKHASLPPPNETLAAQIQAKAQDHFTSLGATGFLLQFIGQPELPEINKQEIHGSPSLEDYQLMYSLPKFDEKAAREVWARALLFCPDVQEINGAWDAWFSPQHEATRLTTNFYAGLVELAILGNIRLQLSQPWANVFEYFVRQYIGKDQLLGISAKDRQAYKEGKKDWRPLYTDVIALFPGSQAPLSDAYHVARKKVVQSRDLKVKHLLWEFLHYIENTLIEWSQLPYDVKTALLKELRGQTKNKDPKKYPATRPVICLSDIECSHMLYALIHQFLAAPKDRAILAEIILFILICQHAAFSSVAPNIDEILGLSVLDVDTENLIIRFAQGEADITGGFTNILRAWIGPGDRQNNKLLLPNLNRDYDKLEKRIAKLSMSYLGNHDRLQPRDFLAKVHIIPGARIPLEIRKKIDAQMELVKGSPYLVNTWKMAKLLRDSYKEK